MTTLCACAAPVRFKPASTMVGVASLVRPEFLVEVEMIAALADRR